MFSLSVVFFPILFNFGIGGAPPDVAPKAAAVRADLSGLGAGLVFERLPNGARAIVKEARWAPVVVADFWLDAGSRCDPPGKWGTAHFVEHVLMREGGDKGVNFSIEMLGGEANAATSRDFVHFYALVPSKQFKKALFTLGRALARPRFDPQAVEAERKVILREIKAVYEDPLKFALEAAFEVAYRSHPYGHPVEGTPRSLSTITGGDLKAFHRERYVARNLCIVVVGDVDAEEALSAIGEVAALFPSGPPSPESLPPVNWPERGRKVRFYLPVERAVVLMALPAPPASKFEEVCATDLALVLLSKGDGARLKRALVDGGLAESVGADFLTRRAPGLFCAYAVCDPKKVPEVGRRMAEEIGRLGRDGPSEEELNAAKGLLAGMYLRDTEGMVDMAGNFGFYETIASYKLAVSYIERLMAVGPSEVASVAHRYINPGRAVVVEILPEGERGR